MVNEVETSFRVTRSCVGKDKGVEAGVVLRERKLEGSSPDFSALPRQGRQNSGLEIRPNQNYIKAIETLTSPQLRK